MLLLVIKPDFEDLENASRIMLRCAGDQFFHRGIDVSAASAPVTALEHARAMAARGYSVDVMLRFYRMGHAYFTERILAGITEFLPDPVLAVEVVDSLQRYAFAYVDRISSEVAAEYVAELDRIQTRARAARTDAVRALIAGGRVDLRRA